MSRIIFSGSALGTIEFFQDVTVPAGGSAVLTFDWHALWALSNLNALLPKTLDLVVEPVGGGAPLATTNFLTIGPAVASSGGDSGLQTTSVDLSAFSGSTVRLNVVATVPELPDGPTHVQFDNFTLGTSSSNASFSTGSDLDVLNIDLGTVPVGSAPTQVGYQIANLLAGDGSAELEFVSVSSSGDTGVLSSNLYPVFLSELAPGGSNDLIAQLDTSAPGDFESTYEVNFTDVLGTNQTLTLNLSGIVELVDDPTLPDLIYDAATGEVLLDAADIGGTLQAYNIKNSDGNILNGNFTSILGGPPATNLPTEIGEFQLSPTATAPGGTSVGFVFPAGMDYADLADFVTGGTASPSFGGGTFTWDLMILNPPSPTTVPEPSTLVLATIGLLSLALYGRRRRRV